MEWRQFRNTNYYVSDTGLVKNTKTGRVWSGTNCGGYKYIGCRCKEIEKPTVYVHRMVAECFLPNPNNYPEVNHKNEDKTDNRVENLEWCDRTYNVSYSSHKWSHQHKKFSEETKAKMRHPHKTYNRKLRATH